MSVTVPMDKINEAIQDILDDVRVESFDDFFENTAIPIIAAIHSEYFSSSSGPDGSWEPWHWRSLDAPESHNTLIVSQKLAFSMQPDADGNINEISGDKLEYGTSIEYAAIHQEGADITTGIPMKSRDGTKWLPAGSNITIPARPFVGLKDPDEAMLAEELADWIVEPLT